MTDYNLKSDEELIACAKNFNQEATETLIRRYKGMITKICRSYFLIGAELDDLIQEGMIGFYKSILNFNQNGNIKFATFAYQCIKNNVLDAIKKANSVKNKPLNDYSNLDTISIPQDFYSGNDNVLKEELEEIIEQIKKDFSSKEKQVFDLFLDGYKTKDIAREVQTTPKSVNNTIYRIKKKITKIWQANEGGTYEIFSSRR